jgi:hypothetical protein
MRTTAAAAADADLAAVADPAEYAALGEHVASVLKAANEAAARIRREAQDDAQRIADASRQEALATLSEANHADKVLFEADQFRLEAEEGAKATCAAAEAYAEQHRREAQEQASRLIAEADQEAARRARETAQRYRTLQDDVVRTEQRLEQLVGGLRELASRLEDVLQPTVSDGDAYLAPAASAEEAT